MIEIKPINETPISRDAAYERETVIVFCDAEPICSYYTRNAQKMQMLRKLAAENPDKVKLITDTEDVVEAEFPKKWLKIRTPIKYSEGAYAELVERGKRLAAMRAARKK